MKFSFPADDKWTGVLRCICWHEILINYKLSSDDIVFSTQLNKLYANGEISATSANFRSKRQQLRKKA